jgi:hypothetical protein
MVNINDGSLNVSPLPEYRAQLLDGGFQKFGRVTTRTPGFGDFDISRCPELSQGISGVEQEETEVVSRAPPFL